MKKDVVFRKFELRDIDFIYRAKNDKRINDTIVGDFAQFSFDDAIQWVKGCMTEDSSYRYWAVCTNDDIRNIVGWCGISNIDEVNKMAYFKTITIYHPDYRDTITWYKTWNFIFEYVFFELCFNRLYACISNNTFHKQFLSSFPNAYEGTMKQALYKNGKFIDVDIYGILRDDYISSKKQGLLTFEKIQNIMKTPKRETQSTINNIHELIEAFSSELDSTDRSLIGPNTKFRDLEEWSSLLAINLVAIAEGGCRTYFDMNDLNKCDTIQDLYEMLKNKN